MTSQYPEPVVGGFILNPQKQILLCRSPKWSQGRVWSVPGGHVEVGETIEQAVKREVKEEVGLKVKFKDIFLVQEAIFPPDFHSKKHFIFFECLCEAGLNAIPKIDNQEIIQAQWFSLDTAITKPLDQYSHQAIEKLLHREL
jgi:nucleoside triphosphatase